MTYVEDNESHIGSCRFCGRMVFWLWDENHWAPPFELWIDGTAPRGVWVKHRCW